MGVFIIKAQTIHTQAQTVISTQAQPLVSQTQAQT